MGFMEVYQSWLDDDYFDGKTKEELRAIAGDQAEIEDRFYKELEFGTGGLRGILGAGTNRMNVYTVRKATQGLANYIKKQGAESKGVAISYDSRRMSPEFADVAALCLNANGIKAYVSDTLRPVPQLSYAVRQYGCTAGIMITASHNPPEYNGYKCYWEDGAQVTSPRDVEIIDEVRAVEKFSDAKTMDLEEAKKAGLYIPFGKELDDKYMEELKKLIIHPEIIKEVAGDLKIVYSPFHGAGNVPVRRILEEIGFKNVYVVKEQEEPDPDFTTLAYPNPEDPKAFELALKLAKEKDADIVMATDPDADRLGIYAKDSKTGEYIGFTGNMSGMLIAEYRIRELAAKGELPKNGAMVKTIVSSNLADPIAEHYGLKLFECLTGFKYIGELIKWFEEKPQEYPYEYVFGYEESYGCLVGTHARDKDAVVAVMCLAEVAAWCKSKGITVWDQMINIYEEYGYFKEGIHTLTLKGIDGAEQIKATMEKIRNNPPKAFGDLKVNEYRDYSKGPEVTGLPVSNVLYFDLSNNSWCCVRPSGTEPKMKVYLLTKSGSAAETEEKIRRYETYATNDLRAFSDG